jgi:OOP family OmpA-OmpF porin
MRNGRGGLAFNLEAVPIDFRSTKQGANMKKLNMKLALMAAALMATQAALAQGYVGGAVGRSHASVDCTGADSCDKTDTGWKLYGGWRWSSGLALEGAYLDWGKASATATDPLIGTGTLKSRGTGFGAGVAYHMPLSTSWNCVGRLGVARNKVETTATLSGLAATGTFRATEPYFGLGCGYGVSKIMTITAEADFSRVTYAPDEKARTQLLTLGARWSF